MRLSRRRLVLGSSGGGLDGVETTARAGCRPDRPAGTAVISGWPQVDVPIAGPAEDLLGRGAFVDRVAEVLDELQASEESSVLALVGPWGSGKSSTINLISERVSGSWQVCTLNTWAPADVPALLADFFAAIRAVLPGGKRSRRIRELLSEYAQVAVPALGAIPVAGSAVQGMAENVVKLRAAQPLQSRFNELARQLRELDLRVLVVLDDVDRLQPDELLMLLKAIRLLARFPGVYYLLAYDEQTVVDVLTCTAVAQDNRDRALAYLEKIVQVRLDVPPAQRFYTEQMLSSAIGDLLARLKMSFSEEETGRFRQLYEVLLQFTLAQPRAVGRFVRQAFAYLPMLEPGEFDVVDFLTLSHLRTLAPASYRLLARSKRSLVVSMSNAAEGAHSQLQDQIKEKLAQECPDYADILLVVLTDLFPALSDDYQARCQTEDWSRWARAKRPAIEEYFDRYFVFGVPADDIADSTVRAALTAIAQERESTERRQVEALLTGPDRARADRLAAKITRLSAFPGELEDKEVVAVLRYVLALPVSTDAQNSLLSSAYGNSVTWAAALIGRLGQAEAFLDPAMLSKLSDAEFTLLCQALSEGSTDRAPGGTGWTGAMLDQVAAEGSDRVLENLRARDQASTDFPVPAIIRLVNRSPARITLAEAIPAEIDADRFTLADLAARLVHVAYIHDGRNQRHELAGFDGESLVTLMSAGVLWQLLEATAASDTGNDQTTDASGTDWPERRRAGLAQLAEFLQRLHAAPPRPPSGIRTGNQQSPLQQTSPANWATRITRGAQDPNSTKIPLCLRAAVLLPGAASGLPSGLGAAAISEQARAEMLTQVLAEMPVTEVCLRTARAMGAPLLPNWKETSAGNQVYADFTLGASDTQAASPFQVHCQVSAGSSRPADNALALALDLVMWLPWPAESAQDAGFPILSDGKFRLDSLLKPCEILSKSALIAAHTAAADLIGVRTDNGHLALWMATTQSLDQAIDLTAFPAVGNQPARSEVSVFATLPLEPGQTEDSADFVISLHATAVELIHELLRSANRREYIEFLHKLRDQS
jgi:KAP family P-loop domain